MNGQQESVTMRQRRIFRSCRAVARHVFCHSHLSSPAYLGLSMYANPCWMAQTSFSVTYLDETKAREPLLDLEWRMGAQLEQWSTGCHSNENTITKVENNYNFSSVCCVICTEQQFKNRRECKTHSHVPTSQNRTYHVGPLYSSTKVFNDTHISHSFHYSHPIAYAFNSEKSRSGYMNVSETI